MPHRQIASSLRVLRSILRSVLRSVLRSLALWRAMLAFLAQVWVQSATWVAALPWAYGAVGPATTVRLAVERAGFLQAVTGHEQARAVAHDTADARERPG